MGFSQEFKDIHGKQILQCSQCGFCRGDCPVFGSTLRPALNARGKMLVLKEVLRGNQDLGPELLDAIFQCTGCASCAEACPSGVRVPEVIRAARKEMTGAGACHPSFAALNELLATHQNIYADDDFETFDRKLDQKADWVYFVGCVGRYREQESTEATLDLLDDMHVDYTLVSESCCSGILGDVGFSINRKLADRNVEAILATGAKRIITGCPYCARTFREQEEYAALRKAGLKIMVISEALNGIVSGKKTEQKITYHDPCDLGRHCGIYEAPRRLIKSFAPNFIELKHNRGSSLCCGAGGGVRGAFAKNSLAMARRRLEEVEESGADILLTECNSCVHNLRNAKLRRQKFKIFTIAEFLRLLLTGEIE